jgi:hypothetical protein
MEKIMKQFKQGEKRIFLNIKGNPLGSAWHLHLHLGLNSDGYKTVKGLKTALTTMRKSNWFWMERAYSSEGYFESQYDGDINLCLHPEFANVELVKLSHKAFLYDGGYNKSFNPSEEGAFVLNENLF